jgi:ABC-2 type transport system permease protein
MMVFLIISSFFSSFFGKIAMKSLWADVGANTWLFFLITLFTIILAAGIVANEFSWGTVNLLLIHPISRGKILLAKYLAMLLFGAVLAGILFGVSLSFNLVCYAFGDSITSRIFNDPSLTSNPFHSFSGVLFLYFLEYADVIVYGSFAFMLSVISRSNAFTIGVSFTTFFFGPVIADYLLSGSSIAKYIIFFHLNLSKYFGPNAVHFQDMSIHISVINLIVYIMFFNTIAWITFVKRDVLN